MESKLFRINSEEIINLIKPMGSCIASDKITVDGFKVGFMYREDPDFETDCGWRFFSGTEDDEYVNNPDNLLIYDVNTIANYDKDIIEFLYLPVGSELERGIDGILKRI